MRSKLLAHLAGSAVLLAGTASVANAGVAPAAAAPRLAAKVAKQAASEARRADKALAARKWDRAVQHGEAAVALDPHDAGYRAVLGAAYLRAGRFASAHQAFADVLVLQPDNARAALNLSLAQIAEGKWDDARRTLAEHAGGIVPADRGLALALAGDTAGGIDVLTAATRAATADAKTRQNLALALALAGRWQDARTLANVDMDPAAAEERIQQWAVFAKPAMAADQVASLLGVVPAVDPGQPVAIALNAPVSVASEASVDSYMPGRQATAAPVVPVPAPAPTPLHAVSTPITVPAATIAPAAAVPSFYAPRVERPRPTLAAPAAAPVASIAPAPLIASAGAYKTAMARPRGVAKPIVPAKSAALRAGSWFVQLGAYDNAPVAKAGWRRATRRYPVLAGYAPSGIATSVRGTSYYRLSVGGFARTAATQLCRGYRAAGGVCFVRASVGEQVAAWHRLAAAKVQLARVAKGKPIQFAAR